MKDDSYEAAWSEDDEAEKSPMQKFSSAVDKMSDAIAMSGGAKSAKPAAPAAPAAAPVAKAKPAAKPAASTGDPVADAKAAKEGDEGEAADAMSAGVDKVSGAMAASGGEPSRRTESEDYMLAYEDLERKSAPVAKA